MIDPNHLRTLRALADHGTVVAAAETLHLSPSAVSQQLNSLARTTGCTLLEKRGRGVVLTQPAKILLEHADAILERFEQAESDMRSYQQGDAAVLRIGGFSSVLQSFVSEAVSTALHRNPGWSIQIDEVESEESMAMLLDRELDVSVVMIAPNRPLLADRRISLEPLLADTYRAVVPAVHPLGALDELDRLSRLAYEPWVLSRHWTSTHEIVMAACAVAGFQPRAAHNTTDFAASVAMVGQGLGVSVIPMLGLPRIVPDAVKILPIRVDPPTRHIAVAVRSGSAQPGSPLAQFRALLKQTVSYLGEPTTLADAVAGALEDAQAPEHEDGGPGKLAEPAKPIEVRTAAEPTVPPQPHAPSKATETPGSRTSSQADETTQTDAPSKTAETPAPRASSQVVETPQSDAPSKAGETPDPDVPSGAGNAREVDASSRASEISELDAWSKADETPERDVPSGAGNAREVDASSSASEISELDAWSKAIATPEPAASSDDAEPRDAVESSSTVDEPRANDDVSDEVPAVEAASNT